MSTLLSVHIIKPHLDCIIAVCVRVQQGAAEPQLSLHSAHSLLITFLVMSHEEGVGEREGFWVGGPLTLPGGTDFCCQAMNLQLCVFPSTQSASIPACTSDLHQLHASRPDPAGRSPIGQSINTTVLQYPCYWNKSYIQRYLYFCLRYY